ncbi:MAG: aromatic-ring-hydroxylating dioxygenase subunit beta [Gammaproteobacteria bacterium]|nr:aromatic-ring-hydroxylating dioxygenase subunit beta [Gammaproteobacteria bacterium]MXY89271.1 aromatic-ring-hydroxylating dioxygenase subunit beta [Gammaproteobacteria bacterium]MXZ33622.1 aromatic-ring-hydroxylating dioxygenase subunit beta [Gammaproteobacteria bacterium]MYE98797.1 aromatic-ring-hydroxylating dioxygenase subunit beta [Gammaproteobacteria bacterium]MYG95576.1 aromatic-ring-hydroxylating dioxygenase subunit beta [Gammaproteobacteria bacterium]
MTANGRSTLRERVEEFLFREAALLDDWKLDEWVNLFTDDARYVVPSTDMPEGDPGRDLVLIDDDIVRLRARASRLNSRFAHRENPRSRTRRFVSNVRVEETGDGQLSVSANVLVYRFRSAEGAPFVGAIDYILRRDGADFKIVHRRAVLDLEDLSRHGAVSIIF